MKKKLVLVLTICFAVSIFMMGCGTAAQRPIPPNQQQDQTADLTATERRVMASSISNVAEQVDGVKRAAVVITAEADGLRRTTTNQNMSPNMNQVTTPGTPSAENAPIPNVNGIGTTRMQNTNDTTPRPTGIGTPDATPQAAMNRVIVMVGLELSEEAAANANRREEIQRQVVTRIKDSDPRVSEVLVTTDPNLIRRINDIAAGIIEGQPIQNFADEVRQLTNDIQPQRPAF